MANTQPVPVSLLMGLPLEVRHNVFEYTATRDVKSKKLLRQWFEKKEVKELIAQEVAANPNAPTPQVVHAHEDEVDSDVPDPEQEEAEESDSDNDDGGAQDGEDDDEHNESEEDDEEAGQDNDAQVNEVDTDEAEDEDEDAMEEDQDSLAQDTVEPPTAVQIQPLPTNAHAAVPAQIQNNDEDGPTDEATMDTDGPVETVDTDAGVADAQSGALATENAQDEVDEDGDQPMVDNDGEIDGEEDGQDGGEDEEGGDGAETNSNSNPPPPPAPVQIRAHRKWRYIPNFMRITHCPPPAELLLASKQLNTEAKNWFYDVAILRISATNSFAHTSFFEEAFEQITEAAFSPVENIRKVEVMFVWDTTWLRADQGGYAEAIFPALLHQRAAFVHKILLQAPDLREVTIHWHDSARDDESISFMLDILGRFHELNATVKIEEHYIAADAKPHKRSIAGRQRVQFQQIVDAGIDRLF